MSERPQPTQEDYDEFLATLHPALGEIAGHDEEQQQPQEGNVTEQEALQGELVEPDEGPEFVLEAPTANNSEEARPEETASEQKSQDAPETPKESEQGAETEENLREEVQKLTESLEEMKKEREAEKKAKEEEAKAKAEAEAEEKRKAEEEKLKKEEEDRKAAEEAAKTPESKEFAGKNTIKFENTGKGLTKVGSEYTDEGSVIPLDKTHAPTLILTKDGNKYIAPEAHLGAVYDLGQTQSDRKHATVKLKTNNLVVGEPLALDTGEVTEIECVMTLDGTSGDVTDIPTTEERRDLFGDAMSLLERTKGKEGFKYGKRVQYEAGSDGNRRFADEYTRRGDLMDWKSHAWTNSGGEEKIKPTSGKIIITTQQADGSYKEYYFENNTLYDMTASFAADEVKTIDTVSPESPLTNLVIGESWDEILSSDDGQVIRVAIGRNLQRKQDSDVEQKGPDPFSRFQTRLRELHGTLTPDTDPDDGGDTDPSAPEADPDNHLILMGEKGKLVESIAQYLRQHGKRVNGRNIDTMRQNIGLKDETVSDDWGSLSKGDVYEFKVSPEAFDRLKNDKTWFDRAKEMLRGSSPEERRNVLGGAAGAAATGEAVDDSETGDDTSELSLVTGNIKKDIVAYLRTHKRETSDENIKKVENALKDESIQGDQRLVKGTKAVIPTEVYEDLEERDSSKLILTTGNIGKDIAQYLRDNDLRVSQANIYKIQAVLRDNDIQRGRRVVQGSTGIIPPQVFNDLDAVKK